MVSIQLCFGVKSTPLTSIHRYDPLIQYQAYYNYTVYPGNTYDYAPYNDSVKSWAYNNLYGPGNCYDMIVDCNIRGINEVCSYADNFCAKQVENIFDIVTGRDEYDVREFMPDAFPPEFFVDYLNTPKVQVKTTLHTIPRTPSNI